MGLAVSSEQAMLGASATSTLGFLALAVIVVPVAGFAYWDWRRSEIPCECDNEIHHHGDDLEDLAA